MLARACFSDTPEHPWRLLGQKEQMFRDYADKTWILTDCPPSKAKSGYFCSQVYKRREAFFFRKWRERGHRTFWEAETSTGIFIPWSHLHRIRDNSCGAIFPHDHHSPHCCRWKILNLKERSDLRRVTELLNARSSVTASHVLSSYQLLTKLL